MKFNVLRFIALFILILASSIMAQTNQARLLRFPDINKEQIVFVYAGDIWTVSSAGGTARKLTSHPGQELFPKISPDGKWIAFSAEYSGSRQVYIIPGEGGEPKQLTYYNDVGPMPPRGGYDYQVLGWTPDSRNVLFRGNRLPWSERQGKYFTISIDGGLEKPLPIPEGGSGELSPDGSKMVYTPIEREWRTWKRTRGGRAQDIWIFDLKNITAERITDNPMTDNMPLWIGNKIYFTSDRDHTLNIFSYDLTSKQVEKLTNHSDYDVLWPSSGPDAIVYQCGGWLYVLDVTTKQTRKVSIELETDAPYSLPTFKDVSGKINSFSISPTGKRALFEARGDLFTVPAAHGETVNLTKTQGVREISPAWSPDGKWISYFSDASGEYEIYLRPADGSGEPKRLTNGNTTWLFDAVWSPDGKMLAYADKRQTLHIIDIDSKIITDVAKGRRADITYYTWSPDSKWLAYSNAAPTDMNGIWVYSLDSKENTLLSSGFSNDFNPVFSKDGFYLLFLSQRDFNLAFSSFEFTFVYNNAARVYAAALTKDAPPLLPFRRDVEPASKTGPEPPANGGMPVRIEKDGFSDRIIALPGQASNYSSLSAAKGSAFYIRSDNFGPKLYRFDFEKQKEEEVLSGIGGYELSADGTKLIYSAGGKYGIVDAKAGQDTNDALRLKDLTMRIEPKKEWKQIYDDAWRLMRDWFYDPNMHGVDWMKMHDRYGTLVPFLGQRADLDFILGELVGELNSGHTYVNWGDMQTVSRVDGGLLGCEFGDAGKPFYRIEKIFHGENWHHAFRSPLTEPGMNVKEGDYLIAINGNEVRTTDNPYRFLENTANKAVSVLINSTPTRDGAREIFVTPISSEGNLRFLDWVTRTRNYVDSVSGGRIGYIWLPNTAAEGSRELYKWFYPQANKEALIVDDRYNGGGFIPQNMISLLGREALNYWARRGLEPFTAPDFFHKGPKVCLMNGYSSSGGDAFPYYFKKLGLGKLIGTRTWGGLIGLTGNPSFIDGGSINIPTFRIFDTEGKWIIENEGVSPDIEVIDRPDLVAKGHDPSIEKAIDVLMQELKANPPKKPIPPIPPDESK